MSLNLFKRLMPAEEAFTPLFCEQAQCIVQAAAELRQMIGEDNPGERQLACRAADRDRVGSDAPRGGPVGRFGLQSGQFLLTPYPT